VKTILTKILILLLVYAAQSTHVTLTGNVIAEDTDLPIQNAYISLDQGPFSDTTNEVGYFEIIDYITIIETQKELLPKHIIKIDKNIAVITIDKKECVSIKTYNVQGIKVLSVDILNLQTGTHHIPIFTDIANGIYIVCIKIGSQSYAFKTNILNNVFQISNNTNIKHLSKKMIDAIDTLRVEATNYKPKKIALYSYNQYIKIVLSIIPRLIDIDSNIYKTIVIGNQEWSVENLRVTHYNDGTPIPYITNDSLWWEQTSRTHDGAYCFYDNDTNPSSDAGRRLKQNSVLYNWYVVNTSKLAPIGWHVPTIAEWTELEEYLMTNGYNYDGTTIYNRMAQSLAIEYGWDLSSYEGTPGYNPSLNNSSGFSAVPCGYRTYYGPFIGQREECYWWTSDNTIDPYPVYSSRGLRFEHNALTLGRHNRKRGHSVRLIKD